MLGYIPFEGRKLDAMNIGCGFGMLGLSGSERTTQEKSFILWVFFILAFFLQNLQQVIKITRHLGGFSSGKPVIRLSLKFRNEEVVDLLVRYRYLT